MLWYLLKSLFNESSLLKFAGTNEATLLEHAILELQKAISAEDENEKEKLYMDSLACSRKCDGAEIKLSLLEAILISLSIWCDSKLLDYHLHFSQVCCG